MNLNPPFVSKIVLQEAQYKYGEKPLKTLVIAPHPDDELLGCGGTLLRRAAEGGTLGWVIVTTISEQAGWAAEYIHEQEHKIQKVKKCLNIRAEHLFPLGLPTTRLDTIPMGDLINQISKVCLSFQPEEVLVPHRCDVHTDHRIVFDAVASCTKWFRYPSIKRVLAYETLSETDFGLVANQSFHPNVFIDIEQYLEGKLQAIDIYASELAAFPFPRSHEAIRALAILRGAASGFKAAEAFELLRERS